ncbi:hypothetical protein LTR48_000080 [Friedmanniomyces endolithicus]|nr:hypothetical protein LTR29_005101 [Friedmanniomyces endolithicus]KAK1094531.1 hypothetical protein LTR48_000080 [Friedmanniomyces endolithicus]
MRAGHSFAFPRHRGRQQGTAAASVAYKPTPTIMNAATRWANRTSADLPQAYAWLKDDQANQIKNRWASNASAAMFSGLRSFAASSDMSGVRRRSKVHVQCDSRGSNSAPT